MTSGRPLVIGLLVALLITACLDPQSGTATSPDTATPDADAQPDLTPSPDATLEVGPEAVADTEDATADPGLPDVPAVCPVPLITIDQGLEVIPQTRLQLRGSSLLEAPTEAVWTVVASPVHSCALFQPSANALEPTLDVNVVGVYTVQLDVKNAAGLWSCEPAEVTVVVTPDEPLHVQLTWDTPGDPDGCDEGPEAGADLDLHFAHPQAATGDDLDGDGTPDPWFDDLYDVYWFNGQPNWGSFNPSSDDDPALTRDDTDGTGPEVLQYGAPEPGMVYRVAVHYWNAGSFGPSTATVKVFIDGVEQFSASRELAGSNTLWNVLTVDWPQPVITLVDGIVDDYPNPLFPQ